MVEIDFKSLKGSVYRQGKIYGGEFHFDKINIEGFFHLIDSEFFKFNVSHLQGVDVFSFKTKNDVEVTLAPTDHLTFNPMDRSIAHIGTIKFKKEKSDIQFGIGPKLLQKAASPNIDLGVGFVFRLRLK